MRRTLWMLLLAAAFTVTACGSGPNPVDTDSIRRNADDADRDLDRESARQQD